MAMSQIEQYREAQRQIELLEKTANKISSDESFKRRIECLEGVKAKIEEIGVSKAELSALVDYMDRVSHADELEQIRKLLTEAEVGKGDIVAFFDLSPQIAPRPAAKTSTRIRNEKPKRTWKHPQTGETYTGQRIAGKVAQWMKELGVDKVEVEKWVI